MPLIRIRRNYGKIDNKATSAIVDCLPGVAAHALTCTEGGALLAEDIMIEVDDIGPFDKNGKDIHIRVWAHDYPSRRENIDDIRQRISAEVLKHLPEGASWYVWVLLVPTSYGSDTEDK